MTRPANHHAFTLIELLVVLTIVAIALGSIFPALGNNILQRTALKSDAARLACTARWAHDLAVCTGSMYQLCVDTRKGQYWAEPVPAKNAPADDHSGTQAGLLSEGVRFTDIQMRQSNLSPALAVIRFSPQGWADAAAIHLADQHDTVRTVRIRDLLATVQIDDTCQNLDVDN